MEFRLALIDDRKEVLDLFQKILTKHGYTVFPIHHTGQTEDALVEDIKKAKASLALIDGNLAAGMKGYEMLPLLRKAVPGIRIFGFSTADSMKEPFEYAGAEGFVLKDPYNPEQTVIELEQEILAKGT